MTVEQVRAHQQRVGRQMSKYHNEPTMVGDERLDSKREARRYEALKLLERAGEISNLKRQVRFRLEVNGHLICNYVADFTYTEGGDFVVEDVKGVRTPVYKIKRALMLAVHGIKVTET